MRRRDLCRYLRLEPGSAHAVSAEPKEASRHGKPAFVCWSNRQLWSAMSGIRRRQRRCRVADTCHGRSTRRGSGGHAARPGDIVVAGPGDIGLEWRGQIAELNRRPREFRLPSLVWDEARCLQLRLLLEERTMRSPLVLRQLLGPITLEPLVPAAGTRTTWCARSSTR